MLDIRVTGTGGINPMKSKPGVKIANQLAAGKKFWNQQGQIGATSLILGQKLRFSRGGSLYKEGRPPSGTFCPSGGQGNFDPREVPGILLFRGG